MPLKLVGAADDDELAAEPEAAEPEAVLETVVPNPPEVDDAAGTVRVFEPELEGRSAGVRGRSGEGVSYPVTDADADPEAEAADDIVDDAEEDVDVGAAPMLKDGVWSKIWALLLCMTPFNANYKRSIHALLTSR